MLERFGLYTEETVQQMIAEERSYADSIVAAIIAEAEAGESYNAGIEIAAREYGFAFAAAKPEGAHAHLVDADLLEFAARAMVTTGEAVFLVGPNELIPLPNYEVDPADRRVSYMTVDGRRFWPNEVVFARWSLNVHTGRGLGPISRTQSLRNLVGGLESAIAMEAGNSPVGHVLPIPGSITDPESDPRVKQLRQDLARKNLKGGTAFVPSTAGGFGEGRFGAPSNEWMPRRIGPAIPDSSGSILEFGTKLVLAAAGVPVELLEKSDGTSRRESRRKFLHDAVTPLANKFRDACKKAKLDITLNFDGLFASDISGRARSWATLVKQGYDMKEAAAVTGLLDEDE